MSVKLSDNLPIYDITSKGLIIGDNKAALTKCFELTLPIVYTVGETDYENMIEDFRKFIELLGDEILIHFQSFYHREYFSLVNVNDSSHISKQQEFIDRSYNLHFNERPYLNGKFYLYISKLPTGAIKNSIINKDFMKTDEQSFIDNILNSASILKKHNIFLREIEQEELLSGKSPITKYLNFSSAEMEELKDIDFSNNKTFIGSKEIKIFSIQEEEQFPTENIGYNRTSNSLPVSNMFLFSYALGVPHVLNQYIYIPNQKEFVTNLEKRSSQLKGYNVKGSNSEAFEDIALFKEKMNAFGAMGAYFHTNIMCFDATSKEIEEQINMAFSDSGFKKKEPTLLRKDIFWAGVPGNGSLMVNQKDNLMCTLLDLECASFLNLEQNYQDEITSNSSGLRLCDRIYGIPFEVDLYKGPMEKGLIKNENTIVLAGSGGGKSFTMNLILLNEYQQGAHVFIIDASYSYKLQTAMHNGVYLTYDEKSKISFNPFYMSWLKEEKAKTIFSMNSEEKYSLNNTMEVEDEEEEDKLIEAYKDYLENKISVLMGIISTMTKNKEEKTTKFERSVFRTVLYNYFKDRCLTNRVEQCKFDDFFKYVTEFLPEFLQKNSVDKTDFNFTTFKLMLEHYVSGNSLGYLLNSEDQKIKNIEMERFVVIDVSKIRENEELFPIISALAMDLYNQKVAKLPMGIKKILCIDEAWQAISSPDMAVFMKTQVKVIRKYGGRTVFISQEPDDFTSSDVIKESIINNSAVKIFLDMKDFRDKFEPIKKILTISDNSEAKIQSLNVNNRDASYREVCICWQSYSQVYAVETPTELKAIFETNADEVAKILPQYEKYGVELAAINYANR